MKNEQNSLVLIKTGLNFFLYSLRLKKNTFFSENHTLQNICLGPFGVFLDWVIIYICVVMWEFESLLRYFVFFISLII